MGFAGRMTLTNEEMIDPQDYTAFVSLYTYIVSLYILNFVPLKFLSVNVYTVSFSFILLCGKVKREEWKDYYSVVMAAGIYVYNFPKKFCAKRRKGPL